MCSGCGKVPKPNFPVRGTGHSVHGKDALASIIKARGICPKCHKRMVQQSGGSWLCQPCGVSRR